MKSRFAAELETYNADLSDYDTKENTTVYDKAHIAILDANEELTALHGKAPTFKQIAEKSGLHIVTVQRHYKKLQITQDIKPRYKKVVFEVLNRHIELMRQNDNQAVALKAVLALEERLFDMIPKAEIEVTEVKQKRLVIEIEDRRKELTKVVIDDAEVEVIDEQKE